MTLFFSQTIMNNLFSKNSNFGPFNTILVKKELKLTNTTESTPSTLSWGFNRFVRFYQLFISPQEGPKCRYHPTCSQYAYISINNYGPLLGTIMFADRFMRCNPFGSYGFDPPKENYFGAIIINEIYNCPISTNNSYTFNIFK